jgi:dihydrofolate reductase
MKISIIAAIGNNRVIGNGSNLPWSLPADLKHFKELTMGKTLIMGSRTFEPLGALRGRKFVVLSSDKNKRYDSENSKTAYSIDEALKIAGAEDEVMIAGGASVYKQFLPIAERMYLTFIDHDFEGDVYFPEYDQKDWKEVERTEVKKDANNPYNLNFVIFERN